MCASMKYWVQINRRSDEVRLLLSVIKQYVVPVFFHRDDSPAFLPECQSTLALVTVNLTPSIDVPNCVPKQELTEFPAVSML